MKLFLAPREKEPFSPVSLILLFSLVLLLILLTCACVWATHSYDNINLEEVVFYLTMPLRGTSRSFIREIILRVFLPTACFFLLFVAAYFLPVKRQLRLGSPQGRSVRLLPLRPRRGAARILLALWLIILIPIGNSILDFTGYIASFLYASPFIEEHYADPRLVRMTFPEKKRNLITVYIESGETTNQDRENGGVLDVNHIPEMTALEKEFVSFSQSDVFEGAAVAPACGWTIAGLVAQTAGIPLKMFRYDEDIRRGADNLGGNLIRFLPGACALGDILEREGYHNVFLAGSDFDFGGRRQFYAQHGTYEILDYFTYVNRGRIPMDYYTGWGFEDEKLYAFAREELLTLAAEDRPFHFAMLTVDTHEPGYTCRLCPEDEPTDYGKSLRCSSRQLGDFIDWCREQSFWENTAIVITGDHASAEKAFYSEITDAYDRYYGESDRLVYNCFINSAVSPVREKNRRFATLDIFPSTLAAMGVAIEGDQLGLGVNLFSDKKTLSEVYGYDLFFTELNKKSLFYNEKLLFP